VHSASPATGRLAVWFHLHRSERCVRVVQKRDPFGSKVHREKSMKWALKNKEIQGNIMKHDETCELNWVKITADSVGWAFHICFALSDSKLDTPRSGPLIRWDITVCEEKRLAPVGDGNREIWKGQSMSEYDLEITWNIMNLEISPGMLWAKCSFSFGIPEPSFESLMQFSGWALLRDASWVKDKTGRWDVQVWTAASNHAQTQKRYHKYRR
jgi:hypothetical protein